MLRRRLASLAGSLVVALLAAVPAQALMVSDQGVQAGVRFVPGVTPPVSGVQTPDPSSGASCDPLLGFATDLLLPPGGLCYHGGPVAHRNETFVLTWDPTRHYWEGTRNYLEQFLRDVADASGSLRSPYAVAAQYSDQHADPADPQDPDGPTGPNPLGQARNASLYGGGCIDYGAAAGFTCKLDTGAAHGAGQDYPGATGSGGCPVSSSASLPAPASCITDQAIQSELSSVVSQTQVTSHLQPEYTPVFVVLVPNNVEVCLAGDRAVCSANAVKAGFCSYHSVLPGSQVPYVVQPWTAGTGCDEPSLPKKDDPAVDAGQRLVSPLSQGHIAAIVNPQLNGWFATAGNEIDDNTCLPNGSPVDDVTIGSSGQNPYTLQPEYNNGGLIQPDPYSPTCAGGVQLVPRFVAPSPINAGDQAWFDGSVTATTLVVPGANYSWDFGDNTPSQQGPSVTHSFAYGGTYTVTLKVADRGGNSASFSQSVTVLGPSAPPDVNGNSLGARLALAPQGLRALLRSGLRLRVHSDKTAAGILTVLIPRRAARRAHIRVGRAATVVIGRGTIPRINGTMTMHVYFARPLATKLARLRHVTLVVRLSLYAADHSHVTVDAAGRY